MSQLFEPTAKDWPTAYCYLVEAQVMSGHNSFNSVILSSRAPYIWTSFSRELTGRCWSRRSNDSLDMS